MIHHVFNSSVVSGPETLVLPNLQDFAMPCRIVLLEETRLPQGAATVTDYARELGFDVHTVRVAGRLDLGAARRLGEFWRHMPPRIVHAHGPKASLHALLAVRNWSGRPRLITTHHGVRANDQSLKLRFYEAVYEKLVISRTDLCLTVCTSDRELLIRRGVPAPKLDLHLNGVGRREYSDADRKVACHETRSTWSGLLDQDVHDSFIVGVVGRLSPEKQHDLILEAFARYRRRRPDAKAKLLCFGKGPLESRLKELSASSGLSDCVHWMGYRSEIATEMTGLDLLLSVSTAEGLPINLIEAGWARTPVLAHGIDGVLDLIPHGECGLLLLPPAGVSDIEDGIARVREDPEGASGMAGRLQERVRSHFSKEAWVRRLGEIYAALP